MALEVIRFNPGDTLTLDLGSASTPLVDQNGLPLTSANSKGHVVVTDKLGRGAVIVDTSPSGDMTLMQNGWWELILNGQLFAPATGYVAIATIWDQYGPAGHAGVKTSWAARGWELYPNW